MTNDQFTTRPANEDGDVAECDCCGCDDPLLALSDFSLHAEGGKAKTMTLCELCANTHAPNTMCFPSQVTGEVFIIQQVNAALNAASFRMFRMLKAENETR